MKQKGKLNEVELKFIRGLFAQNLTWKEIVPPYDEVSPSLNLALTLTLTLVHIHNQLFTPEDKRPTNHSTLARRYGRHMKIQGNLIVDLTKSPSPIKVHTTSLPFKMLFSFLFFFWAPPPPPPGGCVFFNGVGGEIEKIEF
jgi:hypothetical protein